MEITYKNLKYNFIILEVINCELLITVFVVVASAATAPASSCCCNSTTVEWNAAWGVVVMKTNADPWQQSKRGQGYGNKQAIFWYINQYMFNLVSSLMYLIV